MREQRPFWPKQLDAWVIRRRRSEVNRKQSSAGSAGSAGDRSQRVTKRRRTSLRAGVAVIGGRAAGALSRRLHLGGGTSIVGIVAQRLYPGIVGHLPGQLEHGSVMVTGTNGKTTPSGSIGAFFPNAAFRAWLTPSDSTLTLALPP